MSSCRATNAKGDGILRTLDGKPMYLVGRTTDAPATAEPATPPVLVGSVDAFCRSQGYVPADDLRKVAEAVREGCVADLKRACPEPAPEGHGDNARGQQSFEVALIECVDLDAIIAKAVGK